jgi:hypothetical protein
MNKLLLLLLLISFQISADEKLENQFFVYNGMQLTTVNVAETEKTFETIIMVWVLVMTISGRLVFQQV